MLRPLYDWAMRLAAGRYALWALAGVATLEATFPFVPPDVMLAPMVLAKPEKAFVYAGICTAASVLGGLLGYFIGMHLQPVGLFILKLFGHPEGQAEFQHWFDQWGVWVILIKGATPIPYKLVTIASGLAGVSFPLFMLYSAITRSVRYIVIEASLVYFFGERAQALLEKYLEVALVVFLVLVVLGFVALSYL